MSFPLSVVWDLTYACNCNCLHCYNCSGRKLGDELSKAEVSDVCSQINEGSVLKVDLVGGEPLLSPHLFRVAEKLHKGGIALGMISNGSMLDKAAADKIAKYFQDVQISIDGRAGVHDSIRRRENAFEGALAAIKLLRGRGVGVTLSFTMTRLNIGEIPYLLDIADKLGIRHVKLSRFMPLGRGYMNRKLLQPTQKEYAKAYAQIWKGARAMKGTRIEIEKPPSYSEPLVPLRRNWIGLTANGYVLPNPFAPFAIGNIRKHGMGEYWAAGTRSRKVIKMRDVLRKVDRDSLFSLRSLFYRDILENTDSIVPFTGNNYGN